MVDQVLDNGAALLSDKSIEQVIALCLFGLKNRLSDDFYFFETYPAPPVFEVVNTMPYTWRRVVLIRSIPAIPVFEGVNTMQYRRWPVNLI